MDNELQEKTLRQRMADVLRDGPYTSLQLSRLLHASEKEVISNLPHVAKSTAQHGKFVLTPPQCQDCGFAFTRRTRFTIPSKCPRCRGERIRPPEFLVK